MIPEDEFCRTTSLCLILGQSLFVYSATRIRNDPPRMLPFFIYSESIFISTFLHGLHFDRLVEKIFDGCWFLINNGYFHAVSSEKSFSRSIIIKTDRVCTYLTRVSLQVKIDHTHTHTHRAWDANTCY